MSARSWKSWTWSMQCKKKPTELGISSNNYLYSIPSGLIYFFLEVMCRVGSSHFWSKGYHIHSSGSNWEVNPSSRIFGEKQLPLCGNESSFMGAMVDHVKNIWLTMRGTGEPYLSKHLIWVFIVALMFEDTPLSGCFTPLEQRGLAILLILTSCWHNKWHNFKMSETR